MRKNWSSKWKGSKQPRKQRKYAANAPSYVKQKKLSSHLSKPLRKQHKKSSAVVRQGDEVKVLRGDFKGVTGKVDRVVKRLQSVFVNNASRRKVDGTKISVPIHASKIMITKLDTSDPKRLGGKK